jgi:hypothetical protein
MKNISKIIAIACIIINLPLSAKIKYQSKLIEYLHSQAVSNNIVSTTGEIISRDTLSDGNIFIVYPSNKFRKGIITEFSRDTILTQIGVNLFEKSTRERNPYVIKFLERYLLGKLFNLSADNYFANERGKIAAAYNRSNINNWNSQSIDETLENLVGFKIDIGTKDFDVTLKDSLGNSLNILIPKNINLVMGMDKKELDDYSFYRLTNFNCIEGESHSANIDAKNLQKFNDTVYYSKNKRLMKGLDQSMYYYVKRGAAELVFDRKHPLISFKNILLNPKLKKFSLNIKQYLYGGKIEVYEKNYSRIYNCLSKDAEVFAGFESAGVDSIKFLVVFYQPLLLNSHLLSITLPRKIIYDPSQSNGKSVLYTNIRIDNLNDIFKKFEKRKNLLKIEISDEE